MALQRLPVGRGPVGSDLERDQGRAIEGARRRAAGGPGRGEEEVVLRRDAFIVDALPRRRAS